MGEGVGTKQEEKSEREEKSKFEQKIDEAKTSLSDLDILEGKGREYTIAGRRVVQKPLVLRDFGRLFEHFVEALSILVAINPEIAKSGFEIDTENLSPQFLLGMASGSNELMEKIYDIVSMVLKQDRDFLLDNLKIAEFTTILADAIELNDLREIIANFQRMGLQIGQYFQKKKI